MAAPRDYGAPDLSSTQITTGVTRAGSSVSPPPAAGGLAPIPCTHECASGRLRLAEGCLLRETVCDGCGAVLDEFPPLTYQMHPMTPPIRAETLAT